MVRGVHEKGTVSPFKETEAREVFKGNRRRLYNIF
jgi:hypothetical protein